MTESGLFATTISCHTACLVLFMSSRPNLFRDLGVDFMQGWVHDLGLDTRPVFHSEQRVFALKRKEDPRI